MKTTAPINTPVIINGSSSFDVVVLENPMPVLVDFWAPWCAPCREIAPTLDELATEYAGRLLIAKIDADHEPELVAQYGIRSVPTLMLFSRGEVIERVSGIVSKGLLKHLFESLLPQSNN